MPAKLLPKQRPNFKISFFRLSLAAPCGDRKVMATRARAYKRNLLRTWILACAPSLFFASTLAAQTGVFPTSTPQFASTPSPGVSPFETFEQNDIDNVNLQTGNLNLNIPILAYTQLGKQLRMSFVLRFNAPQWSFLVTGAQLNHATGKLQFQGSWQLLNDSNQLFQPLGVDVVRDQGMTQLINEQTFLCLATDGTGSGSCYDGASLDVPGSKPIDGSSTMNAVYSVRDRSGAVHRIGVIGVGVGGDEFFTSAPDGSGWTPAPASVGQAPTSYYDRSGVQYTIAAVPGSAPGTTIGFSLNITDSNGNTIKSGASGWTDSIGRSIPGSYSGPGNGLNSNGAPQEYDPFPGVTTSNLAHCPSKSTAARVWTVPGVGSTSETYYLCYAPQQLQTSFDITTLNGGIVASQEASISALMLNAVILPNLTYSYTFAYDSYGDLTSVTFPTGGSVSYTWTTVPWDKLSTSQPVTRMVSSRTVNPLTAPSGTTAYSWSTGSGPLLPSAVSVNVNVGKPDGNDEYYSFPTAGATSNLPTSSPSGTYSIVSYYNGHSPHNPAGGSGTLIRTETTVKQFYYTPFPEPLPVLPPNNSNTYYNPQTYPAPPGAWVFWSTIPGPTLSKTITYNDNNTVSQDVYTPLPTRSVTYNNPGDNIAQDKNQYQLSVTCNCIQYGEYSAVASYDVGTAGSGKPGSLLRTLKPAYLWNSGMSTAPSYLAANLLDLPYKMLITDQNGNAAAETDSMYDQSNGSPAGIHGNLTSVSRQLYTGTAVETQTIYNSTGMPSKVCQANDASCANPTIYTYDSSGLFPSSVQQPTTGTIQHIDHFVYDENTGLLTSHTDPNGVVTTYFYNDPLDRLSLVESAVGASNWLGGGSAQSDTAYTYPSASEIDVAQDLAATNDGALVSKTIRDGLGRPFKTVAQDGSVTEIGYDPLNRVCVVSNPALAANAPGTLSCTVGQNKATAATDGYTYFSYDTLGRKTLQTQPDGKTRQWKYAGTVADYYDEDLSHWQWTSDGLARLTKTLENDPGGSGTLSLETDYTYNALGNLLSVNQKGASGDTARYRSFVYDSLSRLTNACNPEAIPASGKCTPTSGPWSLTYTYDADGNTLTRTDARAIVTHYTYDALDRLTGATYTNDPANTPALVYGYDTEYPWQLTENENNPIGHLNSIQAMLGTTHLVTWTSGDYDQRGNLTGYVDCLDADAQSCPGFGTGGNIAYDLNDNVTAYAPLAGGPNFNGQEESLYYGYDNANRLNSISTYISLDLSGNTLTSTAFSGLTYYPGGQVKTANLAVDPTTQIPALSLSRSFDNRGRVTGEIDKNSQGQTAYSYSLNYDGNSNVSGYNDSVAGAWTLTNDALHRLGTLTGTLNGKAASFQQTYDHFGNRNLEVYTYNGVQNQPSAYLHFTAGNNQIDKSDGGKYDNAGNLLSDGTNNYLYDAENRLCATEQATNGGAMVGYFYDPNGRRMGKGNITKTFSCDFTKNGMLAANGLVLSTGYSVLPNGDIAEETDGNFNLKHFNVFWEGKVLGTFAGTTASQANWSFALNDWLGTKRQITNSGVATTSFSSGPFGDYLSQTGTGADPSEQHFTGKERDVESSLDYFGARHYSSYLGRFMSPDWSTKPEDVPYADLEDPQSLNLYSYVKNNPLSKTDPDGHCCWDEFTGAVAGVLNTVPGTINFVNGVTNAAISPFTSYRFRAVPEIEADNPAMQSGMNAGAALMMAAPVGDMAEGAQLLQNAAKGAASEARVLGDLGVAKNTEAVVGSEGRSIPDFQTNTTVGEVKDVKTMSNTKQLRIQKEAATESGRQHELHTGTNTKVTPNAENGTTVVRRPDLGPQ